MSAEAFPLYWPEGWPRTTDWKRESDNRFGGANKLMMGKARDQLSAELQRLGAGSIVISTNVALRNDGLPYATQKQIADPGVAVYFMFKKRPMVMARDAYKTVAGNMRSLTLAIEAMRQLERHGGHSKASPPSPRQTGRNHGVRWSASSQTGAAISRLSTARRPRTATRTAAAATRSWPNSTLHMEKQNGSWPHDHLAGYRDGGAVCADCSAAR